MHLFSSMIFTEFEMIVFSFFILLIGAKLLGCHGFLFNMSLDFFLCDYYILEFISLTTEKNCPVLFSLCNDLGEFGLSSLYWPRGKVVSLSFYRLLFSRRVSCRLNYYFLECHDKFLRKTSWV